MTTYTKTGWPKLGTTIPMKLIDGTTEDATVVGHLMGRGPEGRNGLIGVVMELQDGYRESFQWPLVPLDAEEKAERLAELRIEEATPLREQKEILQPAPSPSETGG